MEVNIHNVILNEQTHNILVQSSNEDSGKAVMMHKRTRDFPARIQKVWM